MKPIFVMIDKDDARIHGTRTMGNRTIREQVGYVKLPAHKYPVRIKFTIPDAYPEPYPEGNYQLDPQNFQVGKYEKLELNPFSLYLVPVAASDVKAA